MSRENSINSKKIVERLKSHLNLKTDLELADYLNISHSTLATWKTTNNFDISRILDKLENINLHWLLTGNDNVSFLENKYTISEPKFEYGKKSEDIKIKEVIFRIKIGEDFEKDIKISFHKPEDPK